MSEIAKIVRSILERYEAIWMYEGEPRFEQYHALLDSKFHSNGFADVGRVLKEHPTIRMEIAHYIVDLVREHYPGPVTAVVGADTSSTELALDVAWLLDAKHIRMIKTEIPGGGYSNQVWHPENKLLSDNEIILEVEDVFGTGETPRKVREGILLANPNKHPTFVGVLAAVVERIDPTNQGKRADYGKVVSLLILPIRNYRPTPEHCPYCQVASEAIKPKLGDNWLKLHGK